MRIPIHRGMGQTLTSSWSCLFNYDILTGQPCCLAGDAVLGLCTPSLQTSTGAPVANQVPPAPVAGATQYSPAENLGQMQGAAAEQAIQVQAQAQQAATGAVSDVTGNAISSNMTPWITLALAAVAVALIFMESSK